MKGELPMDRQAVQVKINDGDWQPAMYQDGQFVDLYGLPLDHTKISTWRPAGGSASSAVSGSREFHAPRVSQRAN